MLCSSLRSTSSNTGGRPEAAKQALKKPKLPVGRFDEPEESSIEREPLESKSRLTKLKAMFLKVTVWRCCAENKWRWDSCDKSQQKMYEQKLPQNKGGQTLQKVTQQVCHLVRVPLNVTGVASVSLLLYSSNWWW